MQTQERASASFANVGVDWMPEWASNRTGGKFSGENKQQAEEENLFQFAQTLQYFEKNISRIFPDVGNNY